MKKDLHNLKSKKYPLGRRLSRELSVESVYFAKENAAKPGFNDKFMGRSQRTAAVLKRMISA